MTTFTDPPAGANPEPGTPLDVVVQHLTAFAERDLDGVLDTFAEDAVFTTAEGTVVGRPALRALFGDAFALPVRVEMERRATHVVDDTVVCEIAEHISAEGFSHSLDVAGFYTVRGGKLVRVRVYRDVST